MITTFLITPIKRSKLALCLPFLAPAECSDQDLTIVLEVKGYLRSKRAMRKFSFQVYLLLVFWCDVDQTCAFELNVLRNIFLCGFYIFLRNIFFFLFLKTGWNLTRSCRPKLSRNKREIQTVTICLVVLKSPRSSDNLVHQPFRPSLPQMSEAPVV